MVATADKTFAEIEKLILRIKEGDCVLFLGPELFLNNEQCSIYTGFSNLKCEQMNKAEIVYDESQAHNMYYTVGRYVRGQQKPGEIESTSIVAEKRSFTQFIEKCLSKNDIYEKLAQLPFYLTINTNPDNLFYQLRNKNQKTGSCSFWYYDFQKDNNEVLAEDKLPTEITSDNTVVYNVYGYASKDRERSIIIGESEFVSFTKKVNLPSNGMPIIIKNFIKNDKVCLFLGFQFDSWPLKILLQALGFSSEIPKQNITFSYSGLSRYQSDFFSDEMKFIFIDTNPESFVHQLYEQCRQMDLLPFQNKKSTRPLKAVFISALNNEDDDQKQDIRIRDKISSQFKSQKMNGDISFWSDDMMRASEYVGEEISEKYESADIFILVGSPEILSDAIFSKVQKAISIVKENPSKVIIPVYVRHFMRENIGNIDPQQWIPKVDNQVVPIIDNGVNEDHLCLDVCKNILRIIRENSFQ